MVDLQIMFIRFDVKIKFWRVLNYSLCTAARTGEACLHQPAIGMWAQKWVPTSKSNSPVEQQEQEGGKQSSNIFHACIEINDISHALASLKCKAEVLIINPVYELDQGDFHII